MHKILQAIAEWLLFLFDPGGYHLSGSTVDPTESYSEVTLSSEWVVWRVSREWTQLFLDCWPVHGGPPPSNSPWYTTDLLIRLIEGRRVDSAELTAETARWVEAHLQEIEALFHPDRLEATVQRLQELMELRADEHHRDGLPVHMPGAGPQRVWVDLL